MSQKIFLMKREELGAGCIKRIEANACPIAVYNVDGQFYATQDTCTHATASLAEGEIVDGDLVACPVHDGMFHIPSGQAMGFPCEVDLRTYKIIEEGDDIYADLDQEADAVASMV